MKFKFIKLGLVTLSLFTAMNSHAVSMEDALARAYSKNPDILAQREALKAVNQEMAKALSGYLPNVNFVHSNTRTQSDDVNLFTNPTGKDKDYYFNSSSVQLSQSLFGSGETYYNVKSAEERINGARSTLEKSEQEFLFVAIEAYVNLIHTKKVLELSQNNERILQNQLAGANQRFELGDATRTDVSQSEARFANATSARVIAEGDFISSAARFRRIFQMDVPQDLQMPAKLPAIPKNLDQAIDIAIKKNYDLKLADAIKNSTRHDTKMMRSGLLPQVDATASMGDNEFFSGASVNSSQQQNVGITLTVPLYEGGLTYANIRQARNRAKEAAYNYDNALLLIRNNVVDAWQGIITTDTNIGATQKSLEASEVALRGVKEEQKEGVRTTLDVLDAERERFQAQVSHASAIRDSILSIYRLKAAIGELTAPELNLPVAKYDQLEHYNNNKYKIIGF
jgi:outer membrane protein